MKEYELAKAQQAYSPPTLEEIVKQQADRIAELEKLLEQSIGSDCREMRHIQEIENKDARIAELEKDLHMIQRHYDQLDDHPAFKGLTYADGIEECAQRAEAYAYMSPNFTALAEELRAILRKAQENG